MLSGFELYPRWVPLMDRTMQLCISHGLAKLLFVEYDKFNHTSIRDCRDLTESRVILLLSLY